MARSRTAERRTGTDKGNKGSFPSSIPRAKREGHAPFADARGTDASRGTTRPGPCLTKARGITLLELVVVITVLGIITIVAAVALRDPIRAYAEAKRRAELTDLADHALRRIARDVRLALPNSIRLTGAGPVYMELLLTKTGGRYRAQPDASGAGDPLDLTAADTSFDMLGPMSALAGQSAAAGDILVVQNLFADPAVTTSNAYTHGQAAYCGTTLSPNCITAAISSSGAGSLANETKIRFAARQFPLGSPGHRFQIVSGPVTYACTPGPVDAQGHGTGTLVRLSGYTVALAQPAGVYPGAPVAALLAENVTACSITYEKPILAQSWALVSMQLALTRGFETITLYHEIHVSNLP